MTSAYCPHHPGRKKLPRIHRCEACFDRAIARQHQACADEQRQLEADNYLRHVIEQEALPHYLRTPYKGKK